MNKLRIVIDTNTLISSVLIATSVPDQTFKKAREPDMAEKMTALYKQYGISPDRVANVVALRSISQKTPT